MSGLPSEKHPGVGFFVSPWLRSHVSEFIPHSPRVAELTINCLPHKITVLNVYAPSLVEDPEKDRDRKSKFWSQLEDIVLSHPNQSHLLILGDFNARMDSSIGPQKDHVGPHVVGFRASISDDDRDNAVMLYDFLQSHNFTLPQTFTQLPFRQSVSYKERTCSDHLLTGDNPRDWTTLDYLMCPPSLREVLSFKGSICQQAINYRHLPLSFNLRTRYLPVSKTSLPPKKDYRSMSEFYGTVEHPLLA